MLGDSFTVGLTAEVGKSYVEYLEAVMPDAIVWNTALSGNGTNHALVAFEAFAPELNPQLTILGFYANDFHDNLKPLNRFLRLQDDDGNLFLVTRFDFDRWGNPVSIDPEVTYSYLAKGYNPPMSELERVTGITRLGTLAFRFLDMLGSLNVDESLENQQRMTRNFLTQLRDAARTQDSDMLVLLIPAISQQSAANMSNHAELHQLARRLMQDLRIPYLDPIDLLDPIADYGEPPDVHWNTAGHQKIGALLSTCISKYFSSGNLGDCENVIMP